jgi:catechol 2,3-dioxygenase-like lactoylglutathione lyase family enzyme
MYDHVSLKVKDGARSRKFYQKALAPLGYKLMHEFEGGGGFGAEDKSTLWISQGAPHASPVHVAFSAPDHATVDSFHKAALAAGGKDNGAPGPRKDYGPHYYAAFAFDPDGNNIEAVCNKPVGAKK